MHKAEERKQTIIDNLLAEICDLKMKVDELYQQERDLSQGMDQFGAKYEIFLRDLERKHRDLKKQISDYRKGIRDLSEGLPPVPDKKSTKKRSEEKLSETGGDDNHPSQASSVQGVGNEQKKRIRRHFAQFWHPDKQREESGSNRELIVTLNTIFDQSHDAAQMLITLPWHEVWKERGKKESMGSQWERLIEWQVCLEQALERLTMPFYEHEEDWRYELYIEWKAAENKHDYFSDLACEERAEIEHLERTRDAWQKKWDELKPKVEQEGAD